MRRDVRMQKPYTFSSENIQYAYFEEHLQLQWREAISFLDTRISLEKGPGGHPSTDPLDGDHLTVDRDERCVRVLLHKCRLDS